MSKAELKIYPKVSEIRCWSLNISRESGAFDRRRAAGLPDRKIRHCTLFKSTRKIHGMLTEMIEADVWQFEDELLEINGEPPYSCTVQKSTIELHRKPSKLAKMFPPGTVKNIVDVIETTSLVCNGKKREFTPIIKEYPAGILTTWKRK